MVDILKEGGYEVRGADSGQLALTVLRRDPPDVLLLDLQLGDMDGFQVLSEMRTDPILRDLPTIVVSAHNESDVVVAALSAGAVDYVTKPYQAGELLARVRTQLDLVGMRGRLKEQSAELQEAINELFRSREQVLRASRHAVIAQIAGAVSHAISNPAMGALGYLSYIERKSDDPELRDVAAKATAAVQRIGQVSSSMMALTQPQAAAPPGPFDVGTAVEQALAAFTEKLAELGVEVRVEIPAGTMAVGFAQEFQHALINVLLNAIEAMGDEAGGWIEIKARRTPSEAVLSVSDSGPGVAADMRNQLFDPFVSTKPPSSDAGLGLPLARAAMLRTGGDLTFDPDHGPGARFLLSLPTSGTRPLPSRGGSVSH